MLLSELIAYPSGREAYRICLGPFACWNCGFESRRRHECLLWVFYFVW